MNEKIVKYLMILLYIDNFEDKICTTSDTAKLSPHIYLNAYLKGKTKI